MQRRRTHRQQPPFPDFSVDCRLTDTRPGRRPRILAATLFAIVVAAAVTWPYWPTVPPRWLPWTPLDIADAPNMLTGIKLARLGSDGVACRAVLHTAGIGFEPVPDRSTGPGCGFENAGRAGRGLTISGSVTATCPLVVSWALFERHALQPAAERHFGSRVSTARHYGTYACRNVYGRNSGRRSQHATANAIDIAGFTLDDGTTVSLQRDWNGPDGDKAAFLADVRDGACRFFRGVLGPDYNAAHRDHFHFDRGRWNACR